MAIKPQELRDHATDDHRRGCPAQNHLCNCDYDNVTERMLRAAAKRIEDLLVDNNNLTKARKIIEAEVERLRDAQKT